MATQLISIVWLISTDILTLSAASTGFPWGRDHTCDGRQELEKKVQGRWDIQLRNEALLFSSL